VNFYIPLYRPAHWTTLPAAVKWEYVEAPFNFASLYPKLRVSKHTHGVIRTDRALTADEIATFQLKPA
jgi:hypothetical protein